MHVHTYWAAQPPRIITQAGNLEIAKKGRAESVHSGLRFCV